MLPTTMCCSLLTAHCSLLPTHHLRLTTYYSLHRRGAHAVLPVRPRGLLPRTGKVDLVESFLDGRALNRALQYLHHTCIF